MVRPTNEHSLTTSCMAAILATGNPNNVQRLIIGYIDGYNDGMDWNVWWDEIDNSIYIDDIFLESEMPPDKPGFYVWEGEVVPVYDDAPEFYGEWREATPEDFVKFQEAQAGRKE